MASDLSKQARRRQRHSYECTRLQLLIHVVRPCNLCCISNIVQHYKCTLRMQEIDCLAVFDTHLDIWALLTISQAGRWRDSYARVGSASKKVPARINFKVFQHYTALSSCSTSGGGGLLNLLQVAAPPRLHADAKLRTPRSRCICLEASTVYGASLQAIRAQRYESNSCTAALAAHRVHAVLLY